MIDDGQAVDIKGISERSLIKHLKKLFVSLSLKENGDRVFLLPKNAHPTLDVLGPLLNCSVEVEDEQRNPSVPPNDTHPDLDIECRQVIDDNNVDHPKDDAPGPTRR